MYQFTDDQLDTMPLAEGGARLNALIDPSQPFEAVMNALDDLAEDAEQHCMVLPDERDRFDCLVRLFYGEWGFCGDHESFYHSDNLFLSKVLEARSGSPVTLGAIFLYIAEDMELPVKAVNFPTQFLLRVDWRDSREPSYFDPFEGVFVTQHLMQAWLIGQEGPVAEIKEKDLKATEHSTIIGRWLGVAKGALIREENYPLALRCSDLALHFSPEDPHEHRDRGYIYQQLEVSHLAAQDYQYFIDQCPEDPAANVLKLQVMVLNETPAVLH
ncbi:SirB1 family protein [Thaumasiovibrio subtropicus]|uniref:SirB1 family protein n=1 Tax=Thaumasiovibrio subtropicus TaxID=1891207 RepID=UPI000B353473|nr:SirB1 family protein [Thaumasiovibrio subtropicus]